MATSVMPVLAESVALEVVDGQVWAVVVGADGSGVPREWRYRFERHVGWRTEDDHCGVSARYLTRYAAADAVMDAVRQLVSRSLLEVAALGHPQEIEEGVR